MKKEAAAEPADPGIEDRALGSSNENVAQADRDGRRFSPRDGCDFEPTPAQRSFAEQMLHAGTPLLVLHRESSDQGRSLQRELVRSAERYKSKADIVAFVKKSFADGANIIQSLGDKGMTKEVVSFSWAESARNQHCLRDR